MVALETGSRIKAQLVLLQEPTTTSRIRHPGYRLLWSQEGGNKPRTMVAVWVDGKLKWNIDSVRHLIFLAADVLTVFLN
jgi:hypothetical protein